MGDLKKKKKYAAKLLREIFFTVFRFDKGKMGFLSRNVDFHTKRLRFYSKISKVQYYFNIYEKSNAFLVPGHGFLKAVKVTKKTNFNALFGTVKSICAKIAAVRLYDISSSLGPMIKYFKLMFLGCH